MNKLWKVVIVCVGIVLAVGLYLRTQKTSEETADAEVSVEEGSAVTADGKDPAALQPESGTGAADSGTGFTEMQKQELKEIVKEAVSEACAETIDTSVRHALENCLSQMLEDGRLEDAVTEYAGVQAGLVSINTAGAEELVKLNGIGEAKARAIIAYREEHGPFTDIGELTNVSGISAGTLEKFRDQVTL